jgi:hypothetical protein
MFTALSFALRGVFIINQIVGVVVSQQYHVSTAASIATIGTSPWFIFFPTEADTAPPAVTGRYFDYTLVDKHASYDAEPPAFAKGGV